MRTAAIFCLMTMLAAALRGQDADTMILRNDDQKFTILSQIEDPAEAAAFLTIVKTTEPARRYERAQSFLKTYPRSWLLAQAYDAAARSAIDLSQYNEALAAGRASLRLLPENPSLLILLANVEAQKGLAAMAMADASDALEYLDEIERPPNMSQKEWNAIKPQLKASAYFARARGEASKLGTDDAQNALKDLNKAAAWNNNDAETFYLRAIVELRLNKKDEGAADLAFVFNISSALHDKAERILLLLAKPGPLDAFLAGLQARTIDSSLRREPESPLYPGVLAAGYAGPDACRSCHAPEYTAWQKTGMARMLRPYRPENVFGDFSSGSEFEGGLIRMGTAGRPYFEVSNAGRWQRFYVDFTIGAKWQQGYVTRLPDGRLQVLPIEYNAMEKKWINYWKMIDPPGSPRADIADFTKLTAATNYQQNCAICHTSQLKLDSAKASPMEHATFFQPGIDCEMCHGPSAWHARSAAKGKLEHANPVEPPFDFRTAGNREGVQVCAQCHRQSTVREMGEGGEMNYSTKGKFLPATWMRPLDAFSRNAFYKDGRFRETTFIVEAFTRSACYRRGTAQCASCHSPHLDHFESNQTSLKYQNNPNEMCLPCHAQYRDKIAEHSHHAATSEASQCVACHMPKVMNALLFKARSHEIEVPTADLTERFGQQDSPNVCLTCHSEKDALWAKEQLASWRQ
jgi:tetratricopeptide (TPR) repeat protein